MIANQNIPKSNANKRPVEVGYLKVKINAPSKLKGNELMKNHLTLFFEVSLFSFLLLVMSPPPDSTEQCKEMREKHRAPCWIPKILVSTTCSEWS